MQNCVYYFYINGTKVNPAYKNDLAKEISTETGQQFLREKLTSKLTLYGEGFNLINNADIESEFSVIVEKEILGQLPTPYFKGRFFKTDCAFNFDDRSVEFNVDPSDEYNRILEALDKEIDIVQLAPKITPLKAWKRPIIQVYVPGNGSIDNFLSGNQWQQDVTERITDHTRLLNLNFAQVASLRNITITADANTSIPEAAGTYVGKILSRDSVYYKVGDLNYRMVLKVVAGMPAAKRLTVQRRENGSSIWTDIYASPTDATDPYQLLAGHTLLGVGGAGGTLKIPTVTSSYVFMRLMCDVDKVIDLNTYPIPANDIVVNNLNYRRVIGYNFKDTVVVSSEVSKEPTKWGLTSSGDYYTPPYAYSKLYPLARDTWTGYSLWFNFSYLDSISEKSARKDFNIPSAYFLSDVLAVVLKKLNVGLKFEPCIRSSIFFYGLNKVNTRRVRLMLTQKSNLLHGENASPATNAPTTLGNILKMLKDVFQIYWFVEDGFLRLEHIEFFRNGGSYDYNRSIQIDATKLINTKNKTPLTYGTNKIEFEKEDMSEQYKFEYMDDSSTIFEGLPLVMRSKLVNLGKIENIAINGFSADIDYMMANIEDTSQSGFAVLGVHNVFSYTPVTIFKNTYIPPVSGGEVDESMVNEIGWETIKIDSEATYLKFNIKQSNGSVKVRVSTTLAGVLVAVTEKTLDSYGFLKLDKSLAWVNRYITFKNSADAKNSVSEDSNIGVMSYAYNAPIVYQANAEVPFVNLRIEEEGEPTAEFNAQNGYLAWPWLAREFYSYNLPSRQAYMGEERVNVRGTVKNRKQTIDIPLAEDPTDVGLIRTGYGDGMLDKANINLSSRLARLTLKYDLYDNN